MSQAVPIDPNRVEDILILHSGAVGDLVLTAHLTQPLRRRFANANIAIAARCGLVHWFATRGVIDRAVDIESLPLHRLFTDHEPQSIDWPVGANDMLINLTAGSSESGQRFQRNLEITCPAHVVHLDPIPNSSNTAHVVTTWIDALNLKGIPIGSPDTGQPLVPNISPNRKGIICHPGSGGKSKCARIESFEQIVNTLRQRRLTVQWMIGPTEIDWYGPELTTRLARTASVICEQNIIAAADHLDRAAAYIGNDAGMTHLAAALGLTTVALFGPTNPNVWSPISPHVHVRPFPITPDDHNAIADLVCP